MVERPGLRRVEVLCGRRQIVVDPGIGLFGKTPEQSLRLIRELAKLESLGCPILLGASRKSVIGVVTSWQLPQNSPRCTNCEGE